MSLFKSASIFRLLEAPANMEQSMPAFAPLGASTAVLSAGWVPPRGHAHGALVESTSPLVSLAKLAIETKSVPAREVAKRVDAAVAQIEQEQGRKPGKKERRELKDEAVTALLPHAFAKRKDVSVLIHVAQGLVIIDAASGGALDTTLSALVAAGVRLEPIQTSRSPASLMANILLSGEGSFFVGNECELRAVDGSKARVSFKNHGLLNKEIQDHLQQGKQVAQLALADEHGTEFVLTDAMTLKKLRFATPEVEGSASDSFDADALLEGSALTLLATALVDVLNEGAEQ